MELAHLTEWIEATAVAVRALEDWAPGGFTIHGPALDPVQEKVIVTVVSGRSLAIEVIPVGPLLRLSPSDAVEAMMKTVLTLVEELTQISEGVGDDGTAVSAEKN